MSTEPSVPLGAKPSRKRVVRVCAEVGRLTAHATTGLHVSLVVARLNRVIDGWANYFHLGTVSRAYRAVEQHACRRLRRWLAHKHKVRSGMKTLFTGRYLHQTLGLVDLGTRKGQPLVC